MKTIKMVEISGKKDVLRIATAKGKILLKEETIDRIKQNKIEKGDVLRASELAAILAVKNTPYTIPLCHPIPITGVEVNFEIRSNEIEVIVKVKSLGKTGVEMEALTGVSVGLLTIWDMVKAYEKDEKGQYPETRIKEIVVVEKIKKEVKNENE